MRPAARHVRADSHRCRRSPIARSRISQRPSVVERHDGWILFRTPPGTALSFWTLTSPGTLTPPSVQSFFLLNMAILPRSNSRESRVSRRVVEPSIRSAQIARLLPSEDPLRPRPGKKNAPLSYSRSKCFWRCCRPSERTAGIPSPSSAMGGFGSSVAPHPRRRAATSAITRGGIALHLTQGTQVKARHGEPRAPDICLQRDAATDDPTFEEVVALGTPASGATRAPSPRLVSQMENFGASLCSGVGSPRRARVKNRLRIGPRRFVCAR